MNREAVEDLIRRELRRGEEEWAELHRACAQGSISEAEYRQRALHPPRGYGVWFGGEVSHTVEAIAIESATGVAEGATDVVAMCDLLRESSHHHYDPAVAGSYEDYVKKWSRKARIEMRVAASGEVLSFAFAWL